MNTEQIIKSAYVDALTRLDGRELRRVAAIAKRAEDRCLDLTIDFPFATGEGLSSDPTVNWVSVACVAATDSRLVVFQFRLGVYGWTRVNVVAEDYIDVCDVREIAAEWLKEHEPGRFLDLSDLDAETREKIEETGEIPDHTYTESGWIPSWEWHVNEVSL